MTVCKHPILCKAVGATLTPVCLAGSLLHVIGRAAPSDRASSKWMTLDASPIVWKPTQGKVPGRETNEMHLSRLLAVHETRMRGKPFWGHRRTVTRMHLQRARARLLQSTRRSPRTEPPPPGIRQEPVRSHRYATR